MKHILIHIPETCTTFQLLWITVKCPYWSDLAFPCIWTNFWNMSVNPLVAGVLSTACRSVRGTTIATLHCILTVTSLLRLAQVRPSPSSSLRFPRHSFRRILAAVFTGSQPSRLVELERDGSLCKLCLQATHRKDTLMHFGQVKHAKIVFSVYLESNHDKSERNGSIGQKHVFIHAKTSVRVGTDPISNWNPVSIVGSSECKGKWLTYHPFLAHIKIVPTSSWKCFIVHLIF